MTDAPGPLPLDWAKYKGLYRHGQQVVLSYSINGSDVLESPALETSGDGELASFVLDGMSIGAAMPVSSTEEYRAATA